MPATDAPAASFRAMTFERWPVMDARFMPDGQTIVYSAALARPTRRSCYVLSPNGGGRHSGWCIPNAQLLSVSSRGELALIVNARYVQAAPVMSARSPG